MFIGYLIFVGPFMLIAAWASFRVKSTFKKFSQVGVRSGMTGAEAAAAVVRAAGMDLEVASDDGGAAAEGSVRIVQFGGFLSDHYDPRARTLRLSPDVYNGRSIASIAVAAHEAGHAIQHDKQYAWLGFRSKMVPMTMFGSRAWIWIFMAGFLLNFTPMAWAGVILFGLVVAFQLVTLPVEFDASNRAKAILADTGIVSNADEAAGVSKVLNAAAMTYVAGALVAIMTLLYYVMLLTSGRR